MSLKSIMKFSTLALLPAGQLVKLSNNNITLDNDASGQNVATISINGLSQDQTVVLFLDNTQESPNLMFAPKELTTPSAQIANVDHNTTTCIITESSPTCWQLFC